ncbi:MAG: hypothetical protein ABI471_01615 [Sphingomonas bacterium]
MIRHAKLAAMLGGCAATLLLPGCGKPPANRYAIAAHDAYTRLADADLDDFIMARQCGILIHAHTSTDADKAVTWHITSEGEEQLSFTATLTPVSEKETQIDISVSKDANGKEAYRGSNFYPRPAVFQPIRPAVAELIASTLQARKFDVDNVTQAVVDHGDGTFGPPSGGGDNGVCQVQRGSLEAGIHLGIHDKP